MLEQVKVLLVDDHPVVRKGLRATIEDDPMLVVIGEASNRPGAPKIFARPRALSLLSKGTLTLLLLPLALGRRGEP